MNREILYRGKAINRESNRTYRTKYKNGDWVYGLVEKLPNEYCDLPAEMRNKEGVSGIEVDHKTIGQYTGKTDMYGVKIFEGDKVRYDDDEIAKIEWDENTARFIISGDRVIYDFDNFYGYDLEVIGNIFEETKECL